MAVLIVSALYMGLIFVLLALAVLALKTLSGLSGDREKYRILSKIGCGEREQKRTLLWQLGVFFFFPLLLPLLMSVPVTWICVRFVSLAGFPQQAARTAMYGTAAAVALATERAVTVAAFAVRRVACAARWVAMAVAWAVFCAAAPT